MSVLLVVIMFSDIERRFQLCETTKAAHNRHLLLIHSSRHFNDITEIDRIKHGKTHSKDFSCCYCGKTVLRDKFTGLTIVVCAKIEDENVITMISRGNEHVAMIHPKHDSSNLTANFRSRPECSSYNFELCNYVNYKFIEPDPIRIQVSTSAQNNVRLIASRLVTKKDSADARTVETLSLCEFALMLCNPNSNLKKNKLNTLFNTLFNTLKHT